MENEQRFLISRGLTPEVDQTIITSSTVRTYKGYEDCWNSFTSWGRKGFDPFDTSISQILFAILLVYLWTEA